MTLPSRLFDGSDDDVAFASSETAGDHTWGLLIKFTALSAFNGIFGSFNGSTKQNVIDLSFPADFIRYASGGDDGDYDANLVTDKWYLILASKTGTFSTPRFHIKNVTDNIAWAHADGAAGVSHGATITQYILGRSDSSYIGAHVALAGVWSNDLIDADCEAFSDAIHEWLAHGNAQHVWQYDRGYGAWRDLVGTAHQSAVTGTAAGDDAPLMGITFVGASAGTFGIAPSEPAGCAEDDIVLAITSNETISNVVTPATGFTELHFDADVNGSGALQHGIYWARRGASAIATDWGYSSNNAGNIQLVVYRGCKLTGSPINTHAYTQGSGNPYNADGVTPTVDGCMIVGLINRYNWSSATGDMRNIRLDEDESISIFDDGIQGAAAATGTYQFNSGGDWGVTVVALEPEGATAPPLPEFTGQWS